MVNRRDVARGTVGTVCTVQDFCHKMLFIFKCVTPIHINSNADNFTKNTLTLFEDDQVNEHFDALFRDKKNKKVTVRRLTTDMMLCCSSVLANFFIMIGKHAHFQSHTR